ncbi:hypothetical protein AAG570_014117 [Ranatra chinensis]|uniref:Gag protein n=1 Tax=Ranatra chinensis TaxID=642074 RepID=A0ABD0XUM6_9HEMI
MEQATTTTLEAVAPTPDYTTMAQLAVNIITLMPVGNPGDLEEWLTAAAQAGAHLEAIDQSLPNAIRTSIYGVLLRRMSPAVRADCGIEITTDLACVTRKLKEKYGGFRRPVERSVVKLLRMRRANGESPSDFAHRADQALRLVKQRIQAGTDASAIGYEVRFLEKLVKEAVQMESSDRDVRHPQAPISHRASTRITPSGHLCSHTLVGWDGASSHQQTLCPYFTCDLSHERRPLLHR